MKNRINKDDLNPWEQRADDITDEHLLEWTAQTEKFKELVKKVERPGATLFEGPRGTGKTHLLRYAFSRCIKDPNKPLPVYVTYGKYYHLEPLLNKKANARKIFHVWVLCKLLLGLQDTIGKLIPEDCDMPECWLSKHEIENISEFKNIVEKGDYVADKASEKVLRDISIDKVVVIIKDLLIAFNRTRAILLLDDAALALTPEYLSEFFDVFRNLKSKNIAPKGTVYPGSTNYGPRFHIGQDAKKESVWNIDINGSNELLQHIAEVRLHEFAPKIPTDILQLIIRASFGVPRAFINMVNQYRDINGSQQKRFNQVIDSQVEFLRSEYLSLKIKMPTFVSIIEIGEELFTIVVKKITTANLNLSQSKEKRLPQSKKKQLLLGFDKESIKPPLIQAMIRFLVEAGLMFPFGEIKHGENRYYVRYIPHLSFLIKDRAFSERKRGFNPDSVLEVLRRRNVKHPERVSFHRILDENLREKISLDLPPCSFCGTNRLTESQNFCHNCGNELVNESRFNQCMKIELSDVPSIPDHLKKKVENLRSIRTIGDLLSVDQPASELRKAKGIGKIRSEKYFKQVNEYVEEFLS